MDVGERRERQLLWVACAVIVLGLFGFLLEGADQPADPYIQPAPSSTTLPAGEPPGDPARIPLAGFGEVALAIRPPDGDEWLWWCLLAAMTTDQRAKGLMTVTDLQGYSGMAFLYDRDVENGFYMRNTPTPLSIAWIDAEGSVVSTTDMAPCEDRDGCPTYQPGGPYRYAIEVFQGNLEVLGIVPGATVLVGGTCAPRASA